MNVTGNKQAISAKSVPPRHEVRNPLKAHDVRHLCVCPYCAGMGDDRDTVNAFHPKCFYEAHGEVGVMALSTDDQDKFRMCDIPDGLMRALMEQRQ